MSGLTIVNSSDSVDRNSRLDFPFKIKPDLSIYCTDSSPGAATDSSKAEIFIEFKWNSIDDPFGEIRYIECPKGGAPLKSFLHDTKTGTDTLGQITAYAAAQLGSQFRTHIYSILIVKDTARIIRWDRSGAIVTEAIKYNESPLLTEFFRRYSKAPPDMRGKDQSVSCPTFTEAVAARQALNIDNTEPLVKLSIPGIDGSLLYYVASAPRATFYTPPGRATRGFPSYDPRFSRVVFLKDSWRVDLRDIWEEGKIYARLAEANVRNIPNCVASGNISTDKYHAMKTCNYTAKSWACHSHSDAHFIPHRHYRLALDIIGRSLITFKSSYEMVAAVRDAMIGEFPQ